MRLVAETSADPERLDLRASGSGTIRWALLDRPSRPESGKPAPAELPAKDRVGAPGSRPLAKEPRFLGVVVPFKDAPRPQFVEVSDGAASARSAGTGLLIGAKRGALALRAVGGIADEIDVASGKTACAAYWVWGDPSADVTVLAAGDGWPVVHVRGKLVPLEEYPHPVWTLLVWNE
ncbi:MAG: hypothetical protein HMLKMBBP_03632 [Planctomycetes bacterium]|nr:hypothetical protein [Planctomycetota bacterium]